jgi:ABC-type glycerol-3-phosphate transport system substrate-binding protein
MALLHAGCNREQPDAPPPEPAQRTPSVTLRVLVVNDQPLAEAIERLRGEWSVRSGGQLEASPSSWKEVASTDQVDADVIFFPARYLGTLCERGWLRPVRGSVLQGNTYDADDVFPLLRQRLIRYGGQEMALPLAVELPLVGYRQSWLAQRQGQPPRSWREFHELVQRGDSPVWWPPRDSAAHWEATMLLARAAAYAVHPNHEGVLFDPNTMQPRIAGPPFVRALDQWHRELVWLGSTEGSPQAHPAATTETAEAIAWAELPGSGEVYNHATDHWETAEGGLRQMPLLGGGGQLAGVTATSRNAATAFQLLAWLTSPEIGSQLGPKAAASLPCRRSQLRLVGQWFSLPLSPDEGRGEGAPPLPLVEDPPWRREGRVAAGDSPWRGEGALSNNTGMARAVETALSGNLCLVVPPLPGIDDYLAALDDGVQRALRDELSSADALAEVARQWDQITDARSRESQRRAYLNHLGIVGPDVPVGGSIAPTLGVAPLAKGAASR